MNKPGPQLFARGGLGVVVLVACALVPAGGARGASIWTQINSYQELDGQELPVTINGQITAIAAGKADPITDDVDDFAFTTSDGDIYDSSYDGLIADIDNDFGTDAAPSTDVFPPNPAGFNAIAIAPADAYWVGVAVGNDGQIYRSDGEEWLQVTGTQEYNTGCDESVPAASETLGPLTDDLYSVHWIQGPVGADNKDDSSTVYITGADGDILKSTNSGQSFTEVNKRVTTVNGTATTTCVADPGGPHTAFSDAAFSTADAGYLIESGSFQAVWATNDGMVTAHVVGDNTVNGFGDSSLALDPSDSQRLWLTNPDGADNGSYFSYSLDGGEDWDTPRYDRTQVSLRDISASGKAVVAVGLGGDIYTSADGLDFYRQPVDPPYEAENWHAVAVSGVGAVIGGADGALFETDDADSVPSPPVTTVSAADVTVSIRRTLTIPTGASTPFVPVSIGSDPGRSVVVTLFAAGGRHDVGLGSAVFRRRGRRMLRIRLAGGGEPGGYRAEIHVYSPTRQSLALPTTVRFDLR